MVRDSHVLIVEVADMGVWPDSVPARVLALTGLAQLLDEPVAAAAGPPGGSGRAGALS